MDEPGSETSACSELLWRTIERVFRCGAIGRVLAAAYVRSGDLGAAVVQRIARLLRLRKVECRAREFRLRWRKGFETEIGELAVKRVSEYANKVVRSWQDAGYPLPADPHETLCNRLMQGLVGDSVFLAQIDEICKLPVSGAAVVQKLLALDRAIEIHAPVAAEELFAETSMGSQGN